MFRQIISKRIISSFYHYLFYLLKQLFSTRHTVNQLIKSKVHSYCLHLGAKPINYSLTIHSQININYFKPSIHKGLFDNSSLHQEEPNVCEQSLNGAWIDHQLSLCIEAYNYWGNSDWEKAYWRRLLMATLGCHWNAIIYA